MEPTTNELGNTNGRRSKDHKSVEKNSIKRQAESENIELLMTPNVSDNSSLGASLSKDDTQNSDTEKNYETRPVGYGKFLSIYHNMTLKKKIFYIYCPTVLVVIFAEEAEILPGSETAVPNNETTKKDTSNRQAVAERTMWLVEDRKDEDCSDREFHFYCHLSGECISKIFVCNLYEDCQNGEDELNCNCSDTDFECGGGKCVSIMLTCDGVNDCPNGEDERDEFCDSSPKAECEKAGKFWCGDMFFADCLDMVHRCDGVRFSCGIDKKHDDEANCLNFDRPVTATFKGESGFHVCADGWEGNDSANVLCEWGGYFGVQTNGVLFKDVPSSTQNKTGFDNKTIEKYIFVKNYSRSTDGEIKQILIESSSESRTALKTCKRQLEVLKCNKHFCGTRDKSHRNPSSYIIKGTNVLQETQWPWFASIVTNKDGRPYKCGGSILSSRFILTAAHCLTTFLNTTNEPNKKDYVEVELENIEVTFGQVYREITDYTDFDWITGDLEKKNSQVNKLHIHKNYSKEIKYDIAIIELKNAIQFTPTVKPICLPPVDTHVNLYRLCVAIGYGLTNGGFPSQRLQQVRLMPYAASLCSFKLGNVFDASHMLCAGTYGGVENICLGDSGGPLMCKHYEKDVWFVEGVSGFTTGFQDFLETLGEGSPVKSCESGVYSRVAVFKSWIDSVIGG